MTISTTCPPVTWLRSTLEQHILGIRNSDLTLKPSNLWPGRYELPDGSFIPAVYVVGQNMVPSEWNINGIEMTIEDVPEIENPGLVNGIVSYERWQVQFTNYGWEESTTMALNLRDIARRLARAFPRDPVTYQSRTEATYERLSVRILGPYINPPIP
jgi:hypothetical protein